MSRLCPFFSGFLQQQILPLIFSLKYWQLEKSELREALDSCPMGDTLTEITVYKVIGFLLMLQLEV